MKLLKKLCMATLIAFVLPQSNAGQWYSVATTDKTLVLIDIDTVKKHGNTTDFWWTFINVDPKLKYDTKIMRVSMKCEEDTFSIHNSVMYLNGKFQNQVNLNINSEYVLPGSIISLAQKTVCGAKVKDNYWPSLKNLDSPSMVAIELKPLLRAYFKSLGSKK